MGKLEKAFGEVLRTLRAEKNISQEELGFETDLHRTYISMLERGLRCPTINTIFSIAKALEEPPSKIVRMVENAVKR